MPKLKVKYTLLTLFPHLGPLLVISPLALPPTCIPSLRSARKGKTRQSCHSSTLAGTWQKGTGDGAGGTDRTSQLDSKDAGSCLVQHCCPAHWAVAPEHPGISANPYLMGPAGPGCSHWDKRQSCVPHLEGKHNFLQLSPEKAAHPLGLTQQLLCHRLRQAAETRQQTLLMPGHAAVWHREEGSRNGDVGAVGDPSERGGCLAGSQHPNANLTKLSPW